MDTLQDKINFILNSKSLEEVQKQGIMPDPNSDEGYYFISYSHKDYKVVFPYILKLLESGINLWYDRGLENGESWIKFVKKKVYSFSCKGIIYFVSKNCLHSDSLNKEYNLSSKYKKSSLIISLPDIEPFFIVIDSFFSNNKDISPKLLKEAEVTDEIYNSLNISLDEKIFLKSILSIKSNVLLEISNTSLDEIKEQIKNIPSPKLFKYSKDEPMGDENNEYLLSYCRDISIKKVSIPQKIKIKGETKPVSGIGVGSFANFRFLEEVSLPINWKNIQDYAFYNCVNLTKVDLAKTENGRIEMSAFDNCINLKYLFVPNNVSLIGKSEYLETIEFEKGDDAFFLLKDSPNLKTIIVNSLEIIQDEALANCQNLINFTIPDNCYSIRYRAFYNCKSLESINLPNGLKCIYPQAFKNCIKIKNIIDEAKNLTIETEAFSNLKSLESLVLNDVSLIDKDAFYGCSSLQKIELKHPKEIHLSSSSFNDCLNLKTAIIDTKKLIVIENKIKNSKRLTYIDEVIPTLDTIYLTSQKIKVSSAFKRVESDLTNYHKFIRIENK